MRLNLCLIIVLNFLMCVPLYASTSFLNHCKELFTCSSKLIPVNTWWASIEGGYSFNESPHHADIEPMPFVNLPDRYVSTNLKNSGTLGAALGFQFAFPFSCSNTENSLGYWFPANRVGIFYDYLLPARLSGHIDKWESVTTYHYHYNVSSNALWVDDQLDIYVFNKFTPFVEIGIGHSWNRTSNYEESPLNGVPAQDVRDLSASFKNRTESAFAYRVGAGVNYTLNCRWHLGVLYRFQNFGKIYTGRSGNYPTVGKLSTTLKSNEVLLNLRYDIEI